MAHSVSALSFLRLFNLTQVIIAASMVGAARPQVLHSTYPYASLVDTSFLTTVGYIAGIMMISVLMMVAVMPKTILFAKSTDMITVMMIL